MEYRKIIINSGLSVNEIENLIDSWIFSERDRYILKRVLLDRISYEKVNEEIGLSVRQTKRIASSGMMVLIDHIKER